MFKWWVAVDGYQWVTEDETGVVSPEAMGKDDFGDWPDCHLEPVRHVFRSYEPLRDTGLFRKFAATPPEPAGMLAFANEFGHLGDEVAELGYPLEPPGFESEQEKERWWEEARRFVRLFDPIEHWDKAIREMRRCVSLWEDAQQGRSAENVMEEIIRTVNSKLTGDRFRVAFIQDKRSPTGYAMQTLPTNLLAALWVQFGQAVSENKQFRSCAACGKWFEVAPPLNRKSRHYCSEACRSRAYRTRKEQAVRMKQLGKSTQEIADTLDSTVRTVEGWLRQSQEKPTLPEESK